RDRRDGAARALLVHALRGPRSRHAGRGTRRARSADGRRRTVDLHTYRKGMLMTGGRVADRSHGAHGPASRALAAIALVALAACGCANGGAPGQGPGGGGLGGSGTGGSGTGSSGTGSSGTGGSGTGGGVVMQADAGPDGAPASRCTVSATSVT